MATIYDVAKAAGVSPKTVSRVLNGDAPVGKKTRESIEKAMAELGYVPSNAARMMRSNRSGLVGLITGAISHSPEAAEPTGLPDLFIVQGIQSIMATSGKTLMIADTGGKSEQVPHLIRTFLQHRVEGLIYVADYHQKVELPPIPADSHVVLANCFDDHGTPAILPDDKRGQYSLVSKLIESGHSRIGYLTLSYGMVATKLRVDGYKDALSDAGISFDPALVAVADMEGRDGETQLLWDAIDRMISLPNPPTVLCCGNDKMAMRVYGILRSRGIKVPEQMSVAGYDNYRVISETLYPPLTTVELSYSAMGAQAAQRLLSLIQGEDTDQSNPLKVAGPVCWRSSVTTANNVTKLQSKGRITNENQ